MWLSFACGVTLLLMDWCGQVFGGNPLGAAYQPRHYDGCVLAGIGYLAACCWLARSSRRGARVVLAGNGLLIPAAAIAFVLYHRQHGGAEVQVFWDYEPVTPYHVQLAFPLFVTLVFAAMIGFVQRRSPATTVTPVQQLMRGRN